MTDAGYKAAQEYVRGTVRRWGRGRTILVGVLGALVMLGVGVISAAALVGLPTSLTSDSTPTSDSSNAGASQATPTVNNVAAGAPEVATLSAAAMLIDHVCANKSSGKLFYLASCKTSQTLVPVTSTSTQFKACYVKPTRITRKVSNSTTCRATENTIAKVPANSGSLYFCVDSGGGYVLQGED